jgi:hypothetical protein
MMVGTGSGYASRSIGALGTIPVSNGSDWSWAAASLTNPMTTPGDTIVGGVAGAPTRLAIGTTGQVLTVSSGGAPVWAAGGSGPGANATYIVQTPDSSIANAQALSALATGILKSTTTTGVVSIAAAGTDYVAPSANLTAVSALGTTKGSVLVTDGSTITEIGVGADGTVLTAASGQATGLQWTSVFANPMTAAGDTIIGGASGVATRLAIGTTGQVLTVSSGGAPVWAAGGSGPGANATYIVQTPDSSIANAQALSALATGILKSTTTTGVVSIAAAGTDYVAPSANLTAVSALGTTKGSVLVTDGSTITEIGVGADGTVLTAASGQATGLQWVAPLTNPMNTEGDLIIGGIGGAPTRLGVGTANQVLAVDGTGTSLNWVANVTLTNPMTAADDIIIGGGSGTPIRLGKGVNNSSLIVNGSGSLAYQMPLLFSFCTTNGQSTNFPINGAGATGYFTWSPSASVENLLKNGSPTSNANASLYLTFFIELQTTGNISSASENIAFAYGSNAVTPDFTQGGAVFASSGGIGIGISIVGVFVPIRLAAVVNASNTSHRIYVQNNTTLITVNAINSYSQVVQCLYSDTGSY